MSICVKSVCLAIMLLCQMPAFATLQQINFSNRIISIDAAWVDFDKMSYQGATDRWLAENPQIWHSWIPQSCKPG